MENLLILQYEEQRRELFITARMTNGRCMTVRDASDVIGKTFVARRGPLTADLPTTFTRVPAERRWTLKAVQRDAVGRETNKDLARAGPV